MTNNGTQQESHEFLNRNQDSNLNIKDVIFKYFHYWWLFLLVFILSMGIAWLYLRYSKPVYSVSATLLIRNEGANRSASGGSENIFSDIALFQSSSNKQNEIEILRSRTLMERVVRTLDLNRTYHVIGKVKTTNIYPEAPFEVRILSLKDTSAKFNFAINFNDKFDLFSIEEGKDKYQFGQIINNRFGSFIVSKKKSVYSNLEFRNFLFEYRPDVVAAIEYGQQLEVKPANENSNVLQLNYVTDNTMLGSDILNTLMSTYNNAAIEDKNEINRKIISFIDDRLRLVESQLDSVERDLQYFKTNQNIIDITSQSQQYFGSLSELEKSIREQEIQLQVANLLDQYFRNPANKNSLVPTTLGLSDPTFLGYVAAYNELVAERTKQLQSGATASNPIVVNLDNNIEQARIRLLENLSNIRKAFQATIASLSKQNSTIKEQIASIPAKEKMGKERARQQELKQNLYLYLLQKKEESAIAEASTISSSRVIDKAKNIQELLKPIPLKIYGIAALLALFIPILLIYIIDLLNDRVTTRSDVVKNTNAPIIGEIGHGSPDNFLVFPSRSRTIIAEQFRILRSNLKYVLSGKETNTILVTSSFSGEGKSFVSTNLGASFAISGKKTVILEFDLRKPKVMVGLGLERGKGISNYIVGGASLEELPIAVPNIEDLYVIGCGPVPPNPSELLLNPKITDLFNWLKNNFDVIVIDTAPVGLVSDGFTLGSFADSTLYLVRQRYTFKKQLHFVEDLYVNKKLPKLGLVVNDVMAEGAKSYYGYGSGNYGYGYGYGYGYAQKSGYYSDEAEGKLNQFKRRFAKK